MASPPKEVQSHSNTWTLRLNRGETTCNVAKFEEIWLGAGSNKRKAPRAPVDDPRFFTPPCYMYRQQEAEEHSEDEDYEGPDKMDAFDRPAFKKRVVNQRAIQWVLEDKRDFSKRTGGVKYVGDKTEQRSKYAIFRASSTQRDVIEVTPIHEWWYFKRPPRHDGKMTLKEAEELLKKQEHFVGPLSLANKIEKIIETDEAARGAAQGSGGGKYGDLDREDTQVLKESGLAADDIDKSSGDRGGAGGGSGGGNDEESQDGEGDAAEEDEVPSDAGGEDDDFGEEVRSDDEEEIGNDDANADGGTLHQDDEDLKDSEEEYGSDEDEEISELRKLSRSVNADGEERKDDMNDSSPSNANGDPVRTSIALAASGNPAASSTSPSVGGEKPAGTAGGGDEPGSAVAGGATSTGKRPASAMAGDGADSRGVVDGARAGGASAEGNSTKRPKNSTKRPKKEINQENVVATLKLQGGRLSSKDVLGQFMSALKKSDKKSAVTKLREILNKVATKVDDAIHGQVWVLKQHFS